MPLAYIRQPEYWEIVVVGSLRGTGLAGPAPYTESLEVTATIGTRGFEVVGASTSERFNVPPARRTDASGSLGRSAAAGSGHPACRGRVRITVRRLRCRALKTQPLRIQPS